MFVIYYDNPNGASDIYLKYLKKDCEKRKIEYCVVENFSDFMDIFLKENITSVLPLMPVEDKSIITMLGIKMLDYGTSVDVDNVTNSNYYTDATAQGIYDYITENYSDRNKAISVIGRGKVGKALIDMLIDYGYTVFEFNSKSDREIMYNICEVHSDVIVGLADCLIFDNWESKEISNRYGMFSAKLIDAGNCFDTDNKLRCGSWTRRVLLDRVEKNENHE